MQSKIYLDYKFFSVLMLGPKYKGQLSEIFKKLPEGSYYSAALEILNMLEKEKMDRLETEYTSCFIANYSGVKCPPYESWYIEKTIYGRTIAALLPIYSKYGLNPKKETPDHISTETEFVSFLYLIANEEEANDFVKNHILNWVPKLAKDIVSNANCKYIRLMGEALSNFMEIEKYRIFNL